MDIQTVLANPGVVVGLAAVVLIAGWFLARLLAGFATRLVNRSGFSTAIAGRLRLADPAIVGRRAGQAVRWALSLGVLGASWGLLNSHPDIAAFLTATRGSLAAFFRLPAVLFAVNLLLVGLLTLVLIRAFRLTGAIFAIPAARIEAERGRAVRGLKFQRVQLLTPDQMTNALLALVRYLRYALNLVVFLVYLTAVFSVFPQTRGVVTTVVGAVLQVLSRGWQGFVAYLPSLLNLIIIVIVTNYGLRFIRFLFGEVGKGTITLAGFHPEWAGPTYQLVKFLVIALALVVAFPFLPGSSSPAFQGISVFIGLLFSLGSTSVVANIVSGVVLTYTRAFRVGDRVKIADTVGDVIEKGLLVTRVRTIKNVEVTIPNGMVLGSHIINYSAVAQQHGLILHTTVTLGYDIPWRTIHETLIAAAVATPGVLPEPRPFVLQTSLDDFYVSYELNAYTDQPGRMAAIYSALHQAIQDKCNEAGIEILSPHYGALRDGNASTIPADHLPGEYRAPPFQLRLRRD